MKIYLSGKITGNDNYREEFNSARMDLLYKSTAVLNPAILPGGLEYGDYMDICFAMVRVCDAIYMLTNWKDAPGAKLEHDYAKSIGKEIIYQEDK